MIVIYLFIEGVVFESFFYFVFVYRGEVILDFFLIFIGERVNIIRRWNL